MMKGYSAMRDDVFSDNKLTEKVKRLIGVGIAVWSGCDPCILFQTKQALDADASRDEIMEAVAVAVAMGGSTALGWSWRVVKLLEELEAWED
jgi:AhpD family alkylhydroperoxidase